MNLAPTKAQTAALDSQRAEIYTEQENMSIETLESDNDELKSHVESLTELLLEAKNALLEIEEKGCCK